MRTEGLTSVEPLMDLPRDFGPYRLLKQIAVGGMAEIYLARTSGFGGFEKLLALKMIHPKFSEDAHFITMLIEEAKISVQLAHMNIGQVFDLGRMGERYYIAMEYIEGADVYKVMRRAAEIGIDVPIDSCAHIAHEIASGLDYAHRKRDADGRPLSIIHRDMSPQNVLVSFAGEVKIVDFGIAKAALRAQQTEVGIIKGKYYYMSPEQAWGDPVDHRTDIFSAGIILYEMLTGQMLYLEENIEVLLDRVRKADIVPPSTKRSEVPHDLDAIVMKALAKYPEDRFQSARELGHALGTFLYGFSPDFTPARLAGMMSWLLEDERRRLLPDPVSEEKEEDSTLLTRNDFPRAPPLATGSLLFDLSRLDAAARGSGRDGGSGAAATLDAPSPETTSEIDLSADVVDDGTEQVSLPPHARAAARAAAQRFAFFSSSFEPVREEESPWGEDDDAATFVEPEDQMLHRFADLARVGRGEAARRPEDETRRISEMDISPGPPPVAPRRASRPPPTPPPMPGLRVPPPRPSSSPPPVDDFDDETGPTPTVGIPSLGAPTLGAGQPPAERGSAPRTGDLARLGSRSPPPPRGSAPPPRPVPGRSSSEPPFAAPPPRPVPPGGGLTAGAVGPSPKAPPPRAAPPPVAPPRAPVLVAGADEPTGPTFVAPLGAPGDPDTGPTSIARGASALGAVAAQETGPTRLASPSVGAAPQTAPARHSGPGIEADEGLERPRGPAAPAVLGGGGIPAPGPGAGQAPWLAGIGRVGPSGPDVPRPKESASSDPDMLEADVLDRPPAAAELRGPFGRWAALWAFWQLAASFGWVKIAVLVVFTVALGVGAFLLWPRPVPTARLDIRSHPPGARVLLDGQPLAEPTPTSVDGLQLESVHQVELRLDGFSPWTQPVRMDAERVRQIAVLSPIRGVLRVTSEPSGASVYVDGVYRGVSPREVEGLDINRPVEVQVRLDGQSESRPVSWDGRTEATVHFELERIEPRRRIR